MTKIQGFFLLLVRSFQASIYFLRGNNQNCKHVYESSRQKQVQTQGFHAFELNLHCRCSWRPMGGATKNRALYPVAPRTTSKEVFVSNCLLGISLKHFICLDSLVVFEWEREILFILLSWSSIHVTILTQPKEGTCSDPPMQKGFFWLHSCEQLTRMSTYCANQELKEPPHPPSRNLC